MSEDGFNSVLGNANQRTGNQDIRQKNKINRRKCSVLKRMEILKTNKGDMVTRLIYM